MENKKQVITDSDAIEQFMDFCDMDEATFDEKYGTGEYQKHSKTADDIKIRHEMYHDVYVYPNGHEEWISIGD